MAGHWKHWAAVDPTIGTNNYQRGYNLLVLASAGLLDPWSKPAGRLGVFFDTQTLKRHLSGHQNYLVKNFLECQSQAYN